MSFFKRGSDKSPGKRLPTAERLCEAGHPMGRDWTECPYCKAASNAGRQTRVSDPADIPATRASGDAGGQMHALRETRLSSDVGTPSGQESVNSRVTRIDPLVAVGDIAMGQRTPQASPRAPDPRGMGTRVVMNDEAPPAAVKNPSSPGRRITGIVYTFTWGTSGAIYVLRDGRNYGGSGKVAIEGGRDADVLVIEDSGMSSAHFLILCQSGNYRISDCNSTNGTFVDGKLVDAMGIELVDGARIQAGATLFVFQKIKAPVIDKKEDRSGA